MSLSSLVVVGASAGGGEAASAVIAGFERDLRTAVLVVIHTGNEQDGLPAVLGRSAKLPVRAARDRTALADRQVHVASPDRHLAVQDGTMRVLTGPKQHGFRPAGDVLFHGAAAPERQAEQPRHVIEAIAPPGSVAVAGRLRAPAGRDGRPRRVRHRAARDANQGE